MEEVRRRVKDEKEKSKKEEQRNDEREGGKKNEEERRREREEERKKCLTRAMHNGERRNPLAGVPWNKYMPFVLVTRVGSRARLPPARGSERNASPTSREGWEGWLKVLVSARNSRVKKQWRTNSWLGRMTLREPNIPRSTVSLNTGR